VGSLLSQSSARRSGALHSQGLPWYRFLSISRAGAGHGSPRNWFTDKEIPLMSFEARLSELDLQLPATPKPLGVYKPILVAGNMAYLSGHGPLKSDGSLVTGRLGLDMDVEAGYEAARLTGLAMIATLRGHFGTLDRVKRLVKLFGLVRCSDGFVQQPAVINGCSELLRDLFGEEHGVAARSAVGTNSLPGSMAVEIEA